MPRVSVIIPVYNGEATIARAIDSALAQDFDGFEVIVVNDGSTDGTARILEGYGAKIRVVDQPNRGPAAARNAAARIARGEYLAFLDADDAWLTNMLPESVGAFRANHEAVLSFADFRVIDSSGSVVVPSVFGTNPSLAHSPTMDEMLCRFWPILPSSVVVRKPTFAKIKGFDESFGRQGWEDFYLWLVLREQGPFVFVPLTLTIHTDHLEATPEKYIPGRKRFLRLIASRFEGRSRRLKQEVDVYFASKLLFRGAEKLKHGRRAKGIRDILRAVTFAPVYVARNLHPTRQRIQNVLRAAWRPSQ